MRADQQGFSYLIMLFAVALFGIAVGASVPMLGQAMRSEREAEMIRNASTLVRALRAYALTGQGGLRKAPSSLDDLLADARFGGLRRHLREIPWDPVTRSYDWGLIRGKDGGIVGIFSRSELAPLRSHPPESVQSGTGGRAYRDWHFMIEGER